MHAYVEVNICHTAILYIIPIRQKLLSFVPRSRCRGESTKAGDHKSAPTSRWQIYPALVRPVGNEIFKLFYVSIYCK